MEDEGTHNSGVNLLTWSSESEEYHEYELGVNPQLVLSAELSGLLVLIIAVLSTITTLGNLTVLVSFWRDPKLRTTQNIYIVNLALVDCTIGWFVTPLMAADTLYRPSPFTYTLCKLLLAVDYWVSTHSVLATALISYDRYKMVRDAALYNQRQTRRVAVRNCTTCALVSFLAFSPAILVWDLVQGYSEVQPGECDTDIMWSLLYIIFFILLCFLLPLTVITYSGANIFTFIRRKAQVTHAPAAIPQPGPRRVDVADDLKKSVRAAKSLAALISVFVLCWMPYMVVSVVMVWCEECVHRYVYYVSYWLQYYNSLFNPFIYALTNKRIRHNYARIWCALCYRSGLLSPPTIAAK